MNYPSSQLPQYRPPSYHHHQHQHHQHQQTEAPYNHNPYTPNPIPDLTFPPLHNQEYIPPPWEMMGNGKEETKGHGDSYLPYYMSHMSPSIDLETGDRFSQLLEAKLGLDRQNTAQQPQNTGPVGHAQTQTQTPIPAINPYTYGSTSYNGHEPHVNMGSYNYEPNHSTSHYPTNHTPYQQPTPAATVAASNTFDSLAIEKALQDFTRVQIPPDWVAPAPPPGSFVRYGRDIYNIASTSTNTGANTAAHVENGGSAGGGYYNTYPGYNVSPTTALPAGREWTEGVPSQGGGLGEYPLPPLLKIRVHGGSQVEEPRRQGGSKGKARMGPGGGWAIDLGGPGVDEGRVKVEVEDVRNQGAVRSSPEMNVITGSVAMSGEGSSETGEREKKPIIACYNCRAKKLKCNGERPKCHHCARKGEDNCLYDAVLKRRGPGKKNKRKREDDRSSSGVEGSPREGKKKNGQEGLGCKEDAEMGGSGVEGVREGRGHQGSANLGGMGYGSRFETSTARG